MRLDFRIGIGELDDLRRLVPEFLVVLRDGDVGGELLLLAVVEVLSSDTIELLRARQHDRGLCAFNDRLEEAFGEEGESDGEREGNVTPDAGVDHSRVQEVDGDACALQTLRQLNREHDVGALRHVVQVTRESIQWVDVLREVEARHAVAFRSDNHNPTRRRLLEQVDEKMREQEWSVVVCGHRHLDTVRGLLLVKGVGVAGVVKQHVDLLLALQDVGGEFANRLLRAQVELFNRDIFVTGLLNNFICKATWEEDLQSISFDFHRFFVSFRKFSSCEMWC